MKDVYIFIKGYVKKKQKPSQQPYMNKTMYNTKL